MQTHSFQKTTNKKQSRIQVQGEGKQRGWEAAITGPACAGPAERVLGRLQRDILMLPHYPCGQRCPEGEQSRAWGGGWAGALGWLVS